MAELILNNFKLGQRADGGLREDALLGLLRLVNYDLVYGGETVDLQMRPGYARWNATEFSDPGDQLEIFVDMQENKALLVLIDGLWYEAQSAAAHTLLSAFTATAPEPFAQFGTRAFLGTDGSHADDPGMIWISDTSLGAATKSYRLGIKKPAEPPTLEARDKEGHTDAANVTYWMKTVSQRKFAIEFTPIVNQSFKELAVYVQRFGTQHASGSWKMSVYTDNAGEPSTTLVDTLAYSGWRPVNKFQLGSFAAKIFTIKTTIELTAGTKYWFEFEGDDSYYSNYDDVGPVTFYGALGTEGTAPGHDYGPTLEYNTGTGNWTALANEAQFYIGNMESDGTIAYQYVYTYYNETHGSESRPSDPSRVEPGADQCVFISNYTTPTDAQVEKIRIYRREMVDIDVEDEDVTDTYKHVVDLDINAASFDSKATSELGGILQTLDHFCLDDVQEDDTEDNIRTYELIPTCAAMWKGRLWIGAQDRNHLSYSKVFEEDGPTGMLGLESPDYFPLDNTIIMSEPAFPVNIYPISNNVLIVHLSNDTSYFIYGGDQSLNPPADFTVVKYLHSNASFGIKCGTLWSHKHVFLSRAGLYMSSGIGLGLPEYLTEENQSILDLVTNTNLDDSVVIAVGHELWMLIDFDNDGTLDTVLVLDMQRDVPSREFSDRAFKMYQYDVGLNDIAVVTAGDDFQTVYALDAENGYILELRTGTLDEATAITAYLESHDLTAPSQAMIYQLDLDGYYPDESAIPTYTWLLTDHAGNTQSGTMTPTANDDVRGHRSGTRLKGAVSVRAKVTQVSTKADKLRSIVISHTGE